MNKLNSYWHLENIDLGHLLCPNKLGHAMPGLSRSSYKKGEYVYMSKEDADKIFFINQGRVKIGSVSDEGKEMTKAILETGEVFGELAIAGAEKRRDYAVAMESTDLCELQRGKLKSLMRDHNSLELFFMKLIGSRLLKMENRLESLVFKNSETRIIDFLVELVNQRGERVGYEHVVRKFITHQEIANLTATSRQTVTTVLNNLRAKNLLTFDRRRLLVRDLEKLKELCSNPSTI